MYVQSISKASVLSQCANLSISGSSYYPLYLYPNLADGYLVDGYHVAIVVDLTTFTNALNAVNTVRATLKWDGNQGIIVASTDGSVQNTVPIMING